MSTGDIHIMSQKYQVRIRGRGLSNLSKNNKIVSGETAESKKSKRVKT